ncbi:MAG TPA: hypothetical protein VH209_15720, partial [Steroidobacteraceae bacterium]|nr:hypothetical protein [Steroidobacteraceae bacterium]
ALAVLIQAGLDGIRHSRAIDADTAPALPTSLEAALGALEVSEAAADWLGPELFSGYLLFKTAEAQSLRDLGESEVCRRYAEVF